MPLFTTRPVGEILGGTNRISGYFDVFCTTLIEQVTRDSIKFMPAKKLSVTKTEHVEGKKATRMRKIDYVPEAVTRKEYSFHYHYSIRGRGNKERNLR